ncbi:MAG: hypothetical protein GX622_09410 [Bacteroidales bacterium]|nr:hypothetical protein [Bacteroidales bacterium]
MKKRILLLSAIAVTVIGFTVFLVSCKKDIVTEMTIDRTATSQLDIGDEAIAVITIKTDGVKSFKYYKLIDNVRDAGTEAKAMLVRSEDTYTYNFSYEVQEFDDLHTLGFEFELTDDEDLVKTVGLVVNINISLKSMFVKYDWKVTASTWLGTDVLTAADAAIVYRFNEDGTYQEDLGADYADDFHHFCYWVFKDTPTKGDTVAIVRLVRRLKQGDTAVDEYYDYNITTHSETEMKMYWDLAVWGLMDIENTFKSQPKGAFVPYGTAEMEGIVNANASLSCSNIDQSLLIIP